MEFDQNNIASLEVDPQNGFSEICPDELPVPEALEIVEPLNEQAELVSRRIVSRDIHPPDAYWITDDRKQIGMPIPNLPPDSDMDLYWPKHCIAGTKGAELLKGLPSLSDYDLVISKGMNRGIHPYGAAYQDLREQITTGLIEHLRLWEIRTVIIGGLATDYCVKTTALQLCRAGFRVVVNLAACRGMSQETISEAIEEMKASGILVVKNLEEVKNLLRKS